VLEVVIFSQGFRAARCSTKWYMVMYKGNFGRWEMEKKYENQKEIAD
jgi:hypothetical protein